VCAYVPWSCLLSRFRVAATAGDCAADWVSGSDGLAFSLGVDAGGWV